MRATAAAWLLAMLVLAGCQRTSPRSELTDITDPPEAFSPAVTLQLDQTRSWGGFKIEVEKVFARGPAPRIDLEVHVAYTNLGTEGASPPREVRFELDGKVYPAAPGKVDYQIPSAATSEEVITGTLVGVAPDEGSATDQMRRVLGRVSLVYGTAGTDQAVFPFTER